MPSNIEIKARIHEPEKIRRIAEQLSDIPAEIIEQDDTFFPVPQGRLKLRQFSIDRGELIFYSRPDVAGVKQSNYAIAPTSCPGQLLEVLTSAFGVEQSVKKRRVLLKAGQTRIHLDSVDGLGSFLELEVVLRDGQPPEEGEKIANALMAALDIRQEDLIDCAYADLLPKQKYSEAIS